MTNIEQLVTNAVASTPDQSFLAQYASEIIVAVVTATILGAGAVLWQYFIHPHIVSWQERRAGERRRKEIESSLSQMTFAFGNRVDFRDTSYISVTLPNNTPRSIVIREVFFRPDGNGKFMLFHNPNDRIDRQATAKTRTGFDIPPRDDATWYYLAPDMTGEHPLLCRKCFVIFEYESAPGEISTYEMRSPQKKEKEIEDYFQWAWDATQKKLKGKQPQPGH